MKCPACQQEQNDNNAYCEKCGVNMKPAASNPTQTPYSSNQGNQYSQPNGEPFAQPTYYPTDDAATASAIKASKIMGIISMCLGIVGLVCACFGGFAYSIAALIVGSIAKKKAASVNHVDKKANAGYTMGLIGTIVGVIATTVFVIVYAAAIMQGVMMG